MIKTYQLGEAIPDRWMFLAKIEDNRWPRNRWVLRIKMPWKARIYTINNEAWQLRHPVVCLTWCWYGDSLTHQCTREELERQNQYYGLKQD